MSVEIVADSIDWLVSPSLSQEVFEFLQEIRIRTEYYFFRHQCKVIDKDTIAKVVFFDLQGEFKQWVNKYFPFAYGNFSNTNTMLKYWFEVSDTKYIMFKVDEKGVWGLLQYESNVQWKLLKMYNFLINRGFEPKQANECIEEYKLLQSKQGTLEVDYINLVDGYNCTSVQSCMKGRGEYFLPLNECGKLATFTLNGVEGRAILWTTVEGLPEGCKGFIDRIYPSEHHNFVEAVKDWCVDNKYMYKFAQSYSNKTDFVFNGDTLYGLPLKLRLPRPLDDVETPYMDTFGYYSEGDDYLSNHEGDILLDRTDGSALGGSFCAICGDRHDQDDMYYVRDEGYVCEHCLDEYRWCEDIEEYVHYEEAMYCITDERYYANDRYLIIIDGEYYHESDDDIYYCDDCQHWFLKSNREAYFVEGGDRVVCDCCIADYNYCIDDDEYHLHSNTFEYNNEYYSTEQARDEAMKLNEGESDESVVA